MRRFRIRPFRPALRAPRRVSRVGRARLRPSRRAHRLREVGRFDEAAASFAELEPSAWQLAPEKGALLAVEAGLSFLRSGQIGAGRSHLDSGLAWLRDNAHLARAVSIRARAAGELRSAGLEEQAARLEAAPSATAPQVPVSAARPPSRFPPSGGGILPAEALWADDHSGICGCCGSRLPANG